MLEWYSDNKLQICFDDIPRIGIRYILPTLSNDEKKIIKKYPFINKKNLQVKLLDKEKNKTYEFCIPKGYCFDGASVPRFFWRVIGSNTDNKFLLAALIHDVLCENHNYVDNDRKFSTKVFDSLLKAGGVGSVKRFFMKNSVDIFQHFCCNWKENKKW